MVNGVAWPAASWRGSYILRHALDAIRSGISTARGSRAIFGSVGCATFSQRADARRLRGAISKAF